MNREVETSLERRLDEVRDRLEINRRYYTEDDPANKRLAVYAEAMLHMLEKPAFREHMEDFLRARPEIDAAYAVKLHERATQADLMQHDAARYPEAYDDVTTWVDAFAAQQEDLLRDGVISLNLYTRDLQSNIAERYKTIKLLASVLRDRFDEPPSHLDIGSSVLHGDLKLAFGNGSEQAELAFGPIEIVESGEGNEPRTEANLTHLANTALQSCVEFGSMMGIDITDITDPSTTRWAKSCSFYPDELLDKRRVDEYDKLDLLDPDRERIPFYQSDFSDPNFDFRKFYKESPVREYDLITFSTVFYQVSARERTRMLINAAQLLSPKGAIIIQDAADGDFSKRYNYKTSLIDNLQRSPRERVVLEWETPRCRKATIGMGRLSIAGQLRTLGESLVRLGEQAA